MTGAWTRLAHPRRGGGHGGAVPRGDGSGSARAGQTILPARHSTGDAPCLQTALGLCWGDSAGQDMPWLSMEAEQVLVAQRGFVWKARASKGPLVMTAADYYLDEEGRMRIALYGLVPVVNATGPDLSRSALGRLLVEGLALPSALLPGPNVAIEPVDDSRSP